MKKDGRTAADGRPAAAKRASGGMKGSGSDGRGGAWRARVERASGAGRSGGEAKLAV